MSAGGTIASTWLDRWLTAGENGTPGVCLVDYGADPAAPDYDPGSPSTWIAAHPTLGHGFGLEALAAEWSSKTPVEAFERAYLNVWPRASTITVAAGVDLAAWSTSSRPDLAPAPVAAIALDVAADRSSAAIAVAGPAAGRLVVEVIDQRPGVGWVAGAVKAAKARRRACPSSPTRSSRRSIVSELTRARVTVDARSAPPITPARAGRSSTCSPPAVSPTARKARLTTRSPAPPDARSATRGCGRGAPRASTFRRSSR